MNNVAPPAKTGPGIFKKLLILLLIGFLILIMGIGGCGLFWYLKWDRIKGSGHVVTESRVLTAINGIEMSLDGELIVKQGDQEGISIETDDNLLAEIETSIHDGVLKIKPVRRYASLQSNKMKFTAQVKQLDHLAIAGSGNATIDKLTGDSLKASLAGSGTMNLNQLNLRTLQVEVAGSGDFTLNGQAENFNAEIAGSGRIRAAQLASKHTKIDIAGSGESQVWAQETLNVHVAGSGDVQYYGDAVVKTSIAGAGAVNRLGLAPTITPQAPVY